MQGGASKVETVVEDDCDLPVRVEESRDPSPATTQETGASPDNDSPKPESSDAPAAPSGNRMGNWFQRDGAETPKPSSGNFWFRKQAKSEQGALNLAALKDLDETARRNEEKGTSQQNTPWWKFGGTAAQPISEKQHLNDIHRQYRGESSAPQAGPQGETAIVVRSEPVNVLWGVMSRAVRQSPLWRAASNIQESSKAAAEQRAKQGAAVRHGFKRFFRKRETDEEANTETEKQVPASRVPWWRRFRRNRSDIGQPSADGETSTAIIPHQAEPFADAMRKAAAGVTGTCMVIVGVPLLLFPVPGPGVAMIASGVYVVSTEFEFARSWLETVKTRYGTVFDRLGIEVGAPEALPAPKGSSPILELPPSLPPAHVDEEIKDSNEEETEDRKKEVSDKNEDHPALPTAADVEEIKDSSIGDEALAMTVRI